MKVKKKTERERERAKIFCCLEIFFSAEKIIILGCQELPIALVIHL